MRTLAGSLFICLLLMSASVAQTKPAKDTKASAAKAPRSAAREVTVVNKVDSATEVAPEFGPTERCDRDGNLYLSGEVFGTSNLREIDSDGKRVATFDMNPDSHVKADFLPFFAIGRSDLYVLAFAKEISRYVFIYDSDGKYKDTIKLDPGFAWTPSAFAVFQTGEMLFTGSRYIRVPNENDYTTKPFTGILKADGTLVKELTLDNDAGAQKNSDSSQMKGDRAISLSQAEPADDGNIYLMRWTNPTSFFVISPTGEVVRTFKVDPGDAEMKAMNMHVSGTRVATMFVNSKTQERLLLVCDLEGKEIARYSVGKAQNNGVAFACYSADPEKFTFIGATDEGKLRITTLEAR